MGVTLKLRHVVVIRLVFVLLCSVALVSGAAAQTANVTINGTITDESGAAVPGATVTAINTQTGITKNDTTDQAGRYTILSLAPGFYDVQASLQGFATVVRRNQELLVGTTIVIDFKLQVSSVTQTVEVTAETPVLESTQSTVSEILQTKELDSLPSLTRNFSELAVLAPGVQSAGVNESGTANTAARGSVVIQAGNSPNYETGYIVDGLTNEGGTKGGVYVALAEDWVREFSVMTLQFPAEYGGAAGGVVNVISRSGSNQIHGRAYGFYQNSIFNSNPEFYTAPTKAPSNNERFGGMIGGPIKTGKLFYFAGYENFQGLVTNTIGTAATSGAFAATAQPVGTPAAQLVPWLVYGTAKSGPATAGSRLAMLKLDYTPNATNSFALRSNLEYEYATSSGSGATTFGAASRSFAPSFADTVTWTRTLGSSTVNELRFGFFERVSRATINYEIAKGTFSGVAPNPNPYNYVTTASLGGVTPFGNPDGNWTQVTYSGITAGGPTVSGLLNGDLSGVLTETLTHTRGNHEVKLGVSLRRYTIFNNQGNNSAFGAYAFAGAAGPFNPNTAISQTSFSAAQTAAPLSYLVNFSNPPSLLNYNFPSYALGVFAQDSWKLTGNLTLNIGIRYDINNTLSSLSKVSYPALSAAVPGTKGFIQPGFHNINNDSTGISPRVGVAWTPFHDSKSTVVRGGLGVFYDQDDTNSAAVYINANSEDTNAQSLAANVRTQNPYCIQNAACATSIPAADEIAVMDVLAAALSNYTLPAFPTSTSACAATNSCKVQVGPNTYTIPALSVPFNPQGGLLDIAPSYKTPGTLQVTVGLQHQFSDSLNASVDFVYYYGFNGIVTINDNVVLTGTGATSTFQPSNPAYTTLNSLQATAVLKAKDLMTHASYRDHRGDVLQFAYQFGYSNDNDYGSFAISAHGALSTNPFSLSPDWGPSAADARHLINASGTINLLWGVQLAPIVNFSSALPYTATSALQAPGTASAPPGCLAYFARCYPAGYSRNSVRGAHFFTLNARLSKSFKLGETRSISGYFEGFNLTNYHNLGTNFLTSVDPSAGHPNGNIGTPSGTAVPLRQLQLGARFDF